MAFPIVSANGELRLVGSSYDLFVGDLLKLMNC